jgi:hypothetical protein
MGFANAGEAIELLASREEQSATGRTAKTKRLRLTLHRSMIGIMKQSTRLFRKKGEYRAHPVRKHWDCG